MNENITNATSSSSGPGPAGHTAAIYAARANLKPPLMFEGLRARRYPRRPAHDHRQRRRELPRLPREGRRSGPDEGLPRGIPRARRRRRDRGRRSRARDVVAAPFRVWVGDERRRPTRPALVVIATGAQARWIGLESERALRGRGVSACAGLRRGLLPQPGRRGRRRRRHGDGGGDVSSPASVGVPSR